MPAVSMLHAEDPREKLLREIGDISGLEVFHNNVLIAIYRRPAITAGGIHLTDQNLDEDKWQGKVALIVKAGPTAFQGATDAGWNWGSDLSEGDWVFIRSSDGWNADVNKVPCRMVSDTSIRGRIQHPDQVW